ncbi:unnamed protein product [Amoebophrya sp. A25]|nr:unnamed protein product [Amoebophrya sp. A25]|eukprot:GSA25T00011529001.1
MMTTVHTSSPRSAAHHDAAGSPLSAGGAALLTRVTFRVAVDQPLGLGKAVFVCGSHPTIGCWEPSAAVQLVQNEVNPCLWATDEACPVSLPLKKKVEYNYFVREVRDQETTLNTPTTSTPAGTLRGRPQDWADLLDERNKALGETNRPKHVDKSKTDEGSVAGGSTATGGSSSSSGRTKGRGDGSNPQDSGLTMTVAKLEQEAKKRKEQQLETFGAKTGKDVTIKVPPDHHDSSREILDYKPGGSTPNKVDTPIALRWLRPDNYRIVPTGLEMTQEDDGGLSRTCLGSGENRDEVLLETLVASHQQEEQDEAALHKQLQLDPTYKETALSQLAKLNSATSAPSASNSTGAIKSVFLCAHCLPLGVHYECGTPLLVPLPEENDSMIFALYKIRKEFVKQYRLYFVGAPKIFDERNEQISELTAQQKDNLTGLLLEQDCIPVFLEQTLWESFQNFCYLYLWPITHNFSIFMPQSATHMGQQVKDFQQEDWRAYKSANEKYAETIMRSGLIHTGDIVWSQDWQLLMLGRYVQHHAFARRSLGVSGNGGREQGDMRQYLPGGGGQGNNSAGSQQGATSNSSGGNGGRRTGMKVRCGIYVHVPWPSSDLLKCLPVRGELIRGMLSFDLVGFQIFDYARHFLTACSRLLGVQHVFKIGGFLSLEHNGRSTMLSSKHLCLPSDFGRKLDKAMTVVVGKPDKEYVDASSASDPYFHETPPFQLRDRFDNNMLVADVERTSSSCQNSDAEDPYLFQSAELSSAFGAWNSTGRKKIRSREAGAASQMLNVNIDYLSQLPGGDPSKIVLEDHVRTLPDESSGGRQRAIGSSRNTNSGRPNKSVDFFEDGQGAFYGDEYMRNADPYGDAEGEEGPGWSATVAEWSQQYSERRGPVNVTQQFPKTLRSIISGAHSEVVTTMESGFGSGGLKPASYITGSTRSRQIAAASPYENKGAAEGGDAGVWAENFSRSKTSPVAGGGGHGSPNNGGGADNAPGGGSGLRTNTTVAGAGAHNYMKIGGGGGKSSILAPRRGNINASMSPTAAVIGHLPEDYQSKVILGSVDCIERFAGLTNKMQAIRSFLEHYPQHHKKFLLLQYLYYPPSVTFDDTEKLKEEVCAMAREINARYGYHVHLQIGQINDSTVYSVLQTADIFFDTCTKNGLNIAAFKFILIHGVQNETTNHHGPSTGTSPGIRAQSAPTSKEKEQMRAAGAGSTSASAGPQACKRPGNCLILSEFSGASRALIGALRVNPWSTPNICQQLDFAMNMLDADRYERFAQDYNYISSLSLSVWLSDFLTELCYESGSGGELPSLPVPARLGGSRAAYQELSIQSWASILDPEIVISGYRSCAAKRMLIFDLDGTLLRHSHGLFKQDVFRADPAYEIVLKSLQALCDVPQNTVVVASGRSREQLEQLFHTVNGLHVIAEDGYWYANVEDPAVDLRWSCINPSLLMENNHRWQRIARSLMNTFAKRTQGSIVEENGSCIYWHYGGCEGMFGRQQAQNLVRQLEELLQNSSSNNAPATSIESGNSYVQVRLKGVSKGAALSKFFFQFPSVDDHELESDFTFCLCIGHARCDEDMFKACTEYFSVLREHAATKDMELSGSGGPQMSEIESFRTPKLFGGGGASLSKDTAEAGAGGGKVHLQSDCSIVDFDSFTLTFFTIFFYFFTSRIFFHLLVLVSQSQEKLTSISKHDHERCSSSSELLDMMTKHLLDSHDLSIQQPPFHTRRRTLPAVQCTGTFAKSPNFLEKICKSVKVKA